MSKKPTHEKLQKEIKKLSQETVERKTTEEAYRNIVESSPMGMHFYELRDNDRLVFIGANPAADRLLGVDNQAYIGKTIEEAFPPLLQTEVPEMYRQAARQGILWETEQISYEDNQIIGAFEVRAFQISPNKMAAVFTEITNRKKIEKALEDSEQSYRLIAENVADVIWTMDMNFRFTFISPSIFQLRGYTVEEAMQQSIEETVLPESLSKLMALVNQKLMLIESGDDEGWSPVTFEAEQYCKDGTKTWSRNNARFLPGPNGEPVSILGVTRNITERKLAEDALKKSEIRYRTLFEKSTDAIFIVDRDTGRYLDTNDAALALCGRSRQELKQITMLVGMPEGAWERFDTVTDSEESKNFRSVVYQRPDGTERIATLTTVPIDNRVIIGIARDITDELAMEEQLRQAQKMEAIGTLAGGIAHDFNNILSAIMGYSELALADLPPETALRNKLEVIYRSGERARELVAQILAFSRKDELVRSPVEMHMIIKDALKLLRPAIPTTIDIQTQITSKGQILGDPTRLHQIIMNLCTNAYQAMLQTGGILQISFSDIELEGDAAKRINVPAGSYGKLTISDSGIGISSENIDRIYDPYFTTKEKGKGTGLGLAAVHGIVKSHGGIIFVESKIEKGTKFSVYLPLLAMEKNVPEKQDVSQMVGGNERILLVDDEVNILQIEKEMLEMLGYRITTKESPHDALALFKQQSEHFDLVITDMTMPKMAGDKFAENLKKIHSDTPIILCTGFSETMTKEKAESIGIKGFLMKPTTMRDLSIIIRKVLDKEES